MRYKVKNADGEVGFAEFVDLEKAYRQGLVDPDDMVYEEGAEKPRRAGSISLLAQSRERAQAGAPIKVNAWYLLGGGLAALGLYLVVSGQWLFGVPVIALAFSVYLTHATYRAFRKKPGRR